MKPVKHTKFSKTAKGDRLKWTRLEDVKPVRLTDSLTQGFPVNNSSKSTSSSKSKFFVP